MKYTEITEKFIQVIKPGYLAFALGEKKRIIKFFVIDNTYISRNIMDYN